MAQGSGCLAANVPWGQKSCGGLQPIEGDWPYLWLDATNVKARRDHHIVSVAVIVAVAVNTDDRREVFGMTIGNSEVQPFWTDSCAV